MVVAVDVTDLFSGEKRLRDEIARDLELAGNVPSLCWVMVVC